MEDLRGYGGTALLVFTILYFVIKAAVKSGINESVIGQSALRKNKDEDNEI